jgi:hypothetical protein
MREAISLQNDQRFPQSSSEFARTDFGRKWMRKLQFTIFPNAIPQWGDQVIDRVTLEFTAGHIIFSCAGWEICPTTQRLHLQGFIELKRKRRCRWIMDVLGAFEESVQSIPMGQGSPWPHITPHRGKSIIAWRYCEKDAPDAYIRPGREGMFWSIGDKPSESTEVSQGRRMDIVNFVQAITDNPHQSTRDLVEQGFAGVLLRYPNGARMIQAAMQQRRGVGDPVHVEFTSGPPGTGKTYTAYQRCIALGATDWDIYVKPPGKWWPDYKGQKYIIMDDFRPTKSFTFAMLLRTLDSYPQQVETKGGYVHQNGRFFFITSIMRWDDERMVAYGNQENIHQLGRRIKITWKTRERTAEEKRDNIYPPPVRDVEGARQVPASASGFVTPPLRMQPQERPRDPVASTLNDTGSLLTLRRSNAIRPVRRRLS